MANDLDDMLKDDVKKFRRYRGKGIRDLSPTKMMEAAFWGGAVLSVLFMVGTMPFTGPDKAIAGETWLLISVGGVTVFGGLAFLMRQLPEV